MFGSLKLRMLWLVTGVLLAIMALGCGLILKNASDAVLAEIDSGLTVARQVAEATLNTASPSLNTNSWIERMQVLAYLRHVDYEILPDSLNGMAPRRIGELHSDEVPRWFTRLMMPPEDMLQVWQRRIPNAQATVVLYADPMDEIAEIWEDISVLLLLSLLSLSLLWILLYWTLRRGLSPLSRLSDGFTRLEQEDFSTPVEENAVSELSVINHKFNHMASILQRTLQEKRAIAHQIVSLQEEERKMLSRELHDEMSPVLFSIRVIIRQALMDLENQRYEAVASQMDGINETIAQVQQRVRELLRQLRPMVLNDLSLADALEELIRSKQRLFADIDWRLDTRGLELELPDAIIVTTYRIVQECLTNVARHAEASHASVRLEVTPVSADCRNGQVQITVSDDGKGIAKGNEHGVGLVGLHERVSALGGDVHLKGNEHGGLDVQVHLPIEISHLSLSSNAA